MNETCSDDYDPSRELNKIEFWVRGVVLNTVGVLGIIGNLMSVVILSRPHMHSSINFLLTGLALCDLVLILTSILLFGIPWIYPYTGSLSYYYNYIYPNISPLIYPMAMTTQTANVYMTLIINLERYVAVCHPLKAKVHCTYLRAKIYFMSCIGFAVLFNLSRFWEVRVVRYKPSDGGEALFCVQPSKLRQNLDYIRIYINICCSVVNYCVPLLSLAVMNSLIYRKIKLVNRQRQLLSHTERHEISVTIMLLCVVLVFFLMNFLTVYINVLASFYDVFDNYVVMVSDLLVTINSSTNYVIYMIFCDRFKRIFWQIFCKRRMDQSQANLSHLLMSNEDGTINRVGQEAANKLDSNCRNFQSFERSTTILSNKSRTIIRSLSRVKRETLV